MKNSIHLENGEIISYRAKLGGNKNLVLIHGNMASSVHWDTLMEKMPEEYSIYAFDLRGFGESTYRSPIESITELSKDIEECLQILNLNNVNLIGWSLGGAVCMDLCVHDQENRIKNCVLLCSASTRGMPYYLNSKGRLARNKEEIKKDIGTKTVSMMQKTMNIAGLQAIWEKSIYINHRPSIEHYIGYLTATTAQRNIEDVNYALHVFDLREKVQEIEANVLIISGENDLVVTKEMTEQSISDFKNKACSVSLPGCGHSPMTDDLELLTKEILSFFKKNK